MSTQTIDSNATASYADALAKYVAETSASTMPSAVLRQAKLCLMDAVGVALASTDKPWAAAMLKTVREQGGSGRATIWGYGDKTSDTNAAFANALFVHSMDFNDDLAGIQVGGIMPPTALAVGEAVGASGSDVLAAIAIGYDVATRAAMALNSQDLYMQGFQPTAVAGVFAAAAVAGKLLRLSPLQLANAFGLAASFAGGTIEFLKEGTDTKRFHVAKAALGGVLSATLANAGMTGPRTIFEGENGMFRAYSKKPMPEALLEDLGVRFDILDTSFKFYPFCDGNAAPLEAAIAIVKENQLSLDDVVGIHFRIKSFLIPYAVSYGGDSERKYRPQNELDAQMSLPYCIAAGLQGNGIVRLSDFEPERLRDQRLHAIGDKVTAEGDTELDKIPLRPMTMPAICTIKVKNGRQFEKRIDYQKGDPRNPFTEEELRAKFRDCAKSMLSSIAIGKLEKAFMSLDEMANVGELSALLVG